MLRSSIASRRCPSRKLRSGSSTSSRPPRSPTCSPTDGIRARLLGVQVARPRGEALLDELKPLAQARGLALLVLVGERFGVGGERERDVVPREIAVDAQDQQRAILDVQLVAQLGQRVAAPCNQRGAS